MKKLLFFTPLLFASLSVFAQEAAPDTSVVDSSVIKRQQLIQKYRDRMKNSTRKGFRIQVFSGNQRAQAMKIRTEILSLYPDTRVYLIYKQPTFRVRVGDFLTREEARDWLLDLQKTYKAAFIVPDNILINQEGGANADSSKNIRP